MRRRAGPAKGDDHGALDEYLRRRRRRKEHVGVDERVRDVGEGNRVRADQGRKTFGALRRAIRDEDFLDTTRSQRRREPGTHLSGTDHERTRAMDLLVLPEFSWTDDAAWARAVDFKLSGLVALDVDNFVKQPFARAAEPS